MWRWARRLWARSHAIATAVPYRLVSLLVATRGRPDGRTRNPETALTSKNAAEG